MSDKGNVMTPKERMLLNLLQRVAKPDWGNLPPRSDTGPYVTYEEAEVGDLVICQTSGRYGMHRCIAGYVVEKRSRSHLLIRELGGDFLCDVSNESFYPVRGLGRDPEMLPERQYRFHRKVLKAFSWADAHFHLFAGIDFEPDRIAKIWVRERWGGMMRRDEEGNHTLSIPYSISMKWYAKTTIKAILAALDAGGFQEREFETKIDPDRPRDATTALVTVTG